MPADPAPKSRSGPLPPLIGRAFEPLYRAAITRRNRRYDRGLGVVDLGLPVISVGNLSVGGTGKTPMVMHIAAMLLRAGHRPCIAMRGYKSRRPGESDEADSYRRAFPTIPIVAQPDRTAGLRTLLARSTDAARPTCIILDDGFQHRKLARAADIVLIDASRSPFTDHLLPAGWLREPVESLRRATFIALTHAEMAPAHELERLCAAIARLRGCAPDAVTRHAWMGLLRAEDPLPLDWLGGKRVVAACAIGNPQPFLRALHLALETDPAHRGILAGAMILPDHDPFAPGTVASLARMADEARADAILVTDKDWSKLRHVPPEGWGGRPVVRPLLTLAFDRGLEDLGRAVLTAVT